MLKKCFLLTIFAVLLAVAWVLRAHWREVLPYHLRATFVAIRDNTPLPYSKPQGLAKAKAGNAAATASYLDSLDISSFANRGAKFANFKISEWQGQSLSNDDITYKYDLRALDKLAQRLQGVERHIVLKKIYDEITEGAKSPKERFKKVVAFLQKASFHHPFRQPTLANRQTVLDPLMLLELNEMRCSQVSFVGTDIFRAGGVPARSVQLGGHVIGEAFYDDDWHYYDADLFSGGVIYEDEKGEIPSVIELSHHPSWIDSLPPTFENVCCGGPVYSVRYPSFVYFNKKAYGSVEPMYYEKQKQVGEEENTVYGWNHLAKIVDEKRRLVEEPGRYQPAPPVWESVTVNLERLTAQISWQSSYDGDGDLAGYRIFVSNSGRGWNFATKKDHPLRRYFSDYGPWRPEQYSLLVRRPPADVSEVYTEKTSLSLSFNKAGTYYVSIMAEDKYGQSIGRKLYHLSEELTIKLD